MSKTVRYKLSEQEFRIVQEAAKGLGITVDKLGRQSLLYVLQKAQELGAAIEEKDKEQPDDK